MNRNGRRIALSMIAIVLGAGYLMKIIPPETDIGTNDSHSISIDGALVSNPLDLGEAPHRSPPPVSSSNPNPRIEATPPDHSDDGSLTSVSSSLDPAPVVPFVRTGSSETPGSLPNEASGPGADVPSELDVPPTPSPVGEVAINSSAPGNGWSPTATGSDPSPGSPPALNPDPNPGDGPILLPPLAPNDPDSQPNIDLPSDPQGPGPKGPQTDNPKFTDQLPDSWTPPEAPTGTDLPSHQVPESGMMLTMLGFSLVLLAAMRTRLEKTGA